MFHLAPHSSPRYDWEDGGSIWRPPFNTPIWSNYTESLEASWDPQKYGVRILLIARTKCPAIVPSLAASQMHG